MLPGLSRVAFLLASASAVGGGGATYTVGINNETISKVNTDGTAATASFTFRTDRTVRDQDNAVLDSAWVSSGATVGNYSIRVTVTSGSTPTGTVGSWLALSSNRTWSLTDAAGAAGTKSSTLKVEIKDNASGVILDTATYTMTADSQAAGATTTYSPVAGTYTSSDVASTIYTVTASASVVWTWSATSSTGLTSSVASGGSATSIQFTLTATGSVDHATTITLTSGGKTWTLNLTAYADVSGTTTRACVTENTPLWVATDATSSGLMYANAGSLSVGDLMYTQHEDTLEWGNFEIEAIRIVPDQEVYTIELMGETLRATPDHRFYIDGKWQTIRELGGVPDGTANVAKISVKDAHTYISAGVLSHNIKP